MFWDTALRKNLAPLFPFLTAIFLDGPGLAGTRIFSFWILLELKTMKVLVTTGAVRCAKLQSNRHQQYINTQPFYRPDALPFRPTYAK